MLRIKGTSHGGTGDIWVRPRCAGTANGTRDQDNLRKGHAPRNIQSRPASFSRNTIPFAPFASCTTSAPRAATSAIAFFILFSTFTRTTRPPISFAARSTSDMLSLPLSSAHFTVPLLPRSPSLSRVVSPPSPFRVVLLTRVTLRGGCMEIGGSGNTVAGLSRRLLGSARSAKPG